MKANASESFCCLCMDVGTTTSRVWLVNGGVIMARRSETIGVRDTAHDGNKDRLFSSLGRLIESVREVAAGRGYVPAEVLGAGMVTSALGLLEIPHLRAPIGVDDLRAGAVRREFPTITDLPFFLVPGVATPGGKPELSDVMRGEEVLCAGLLAEGMLSEGGTVLNLGSHWKAITVDRKGEIVRSHTTIAGELMFATQMNTVLRSSLPEERPSTYSWEWLRRGFLQEREQGLMRALFCIRLLQLGGEGTPEDRQAFLAGAFISNTLSGMRPWLSGPLVVTGNEAIGEAWLRILKEEGMEAALCEGDSLERSFVSGLLLIHGHSSGISQGL